jgi:C-terminal processing protease CtpA/Prc
MLPALLLTTGCDKETDPDDEVNPLAAANQNLYNYMNDYYLWYQYLPEVNPASYVDPYVLMDDIIYKENDRFSYVADREEYEAYFNQGVYAGHGISYSLDQSGKIRILFIYEDSPLYSEGVRRSWIVNKINGTAVYTNSFDNASLNALFSLVSQLMGPSTVGHTNTFEFEDPEGNLHTITSAKKKITINSVLHYDTLQIQGEVVGHLVFETFIDHSYDELEEAFAFFKAQGASELILDMRYNGGGTMDVARVLGSYITGPSTSGQTFVTYRFNAKLASENFAIYMESFSESLDLDRLFVITGYGTASASESVINSLKPYIDVLMVGDTTYGKPVGMIPQNYQDFVWVPIMFEMVNKNGEGDYYDGIPPDFYVFDDPTHDFSDREEDCLQAVIQYLETGSFGSLKSGQRDFRRPAKGSWLQKDYWIY